MDEAEWLTSDVVGAMLDRLRERPNNPGFPVGDRKYLLFVAACCRTIPSRGDDWESFLDAVGQLEMAADVDPYVSTQLINIYFHPDWDAFTLACWASKDIKSAPALLRDIIGNPFRPVAPFMPPGTFLHSDLWGLAYGMAREAYEARDWTSLPVLADVLFDAGLEEQAVLDHLRSGGKHVVGCWALDMVLNKE